jgi:hypothetical protein
MTSGWAGSDAAERSEPSSAVEGARHGSTGSGSGRQEPYDQPVSSAQMGAG